MADPIPDYKEFMRQLAERDREILRKHQEGICPKAIAMDYNIDRARVCQILRRFRERGILKPG